MPTPAFVWIVGVLCGFGVCAMCFSYAMCGFLFRLEALSCYRVVLFG
jgi:hypothetical protein